MIGPKSDIESFWVLGAWFATFIRILAHMHKLLIFLLYKQNSDHNSMIYLTKMKMIVQ